MPVTTVPKPCIENVRSIGSRAAPSVAATGDARADVSTSAVRKLVEAGAGPRRHRQDRRALEKRSRDELAHFQSHELQRLVVHEIRLGEDDDALLDVQQPADVEVLARLRHDRFVGRDDQQHAVEPADAGEHRLHESLVARHVDERDGHVRPARCGQTPARW